MRAIGVTPVNDAFNPAVAEAMEAYAGTAIMAAVPGIGAEAFGGIIESGATRAIATEPALADESAHALGSAIDLNKQLASEAQMGEMTSGGGDAIAGRGTS